MNKKKIYKICITILLVAVVVLLAWYFKFITFCIVLAAVLALIGHPLMRLLEYPHAVYVVLLAVSNGVFASR